MEVPEWLPSLSPRITALRRTGRLSADLGLGTTERRLWEVLLPTSHLRFHKSRNLSWHEAYSCTYVRRRNQFPVILLLTLLPQQVLRWQALSHNLTAFSALCVLRLFWFYSVSQPKPHGVTIKNLTSLDGSKWCLMAINCKTPIGFCSFWSVLILG